MGIGLAGVMAKFELVAGNCESSLGGVSRTSAEFTG